MKVTIIPSDGFVSIDGVGYSDLDLSGIDATIHAVQWWGGAGEVEIKNTTTGKMVENRVIDSISEFQNALDAWQGARDAEAAAIAEAEAAAIAEAEAAAIAEAEAEAEASRLAAAEASRLAAEEANTEAGPTQG